MKRVLALLLVVAFVATIAAPSFAATAVTKKVPAKKKVVKKAAPKKAVKKAAPVKEVLPPPPPPAVVTPPPPPAPVKVVAASSGLFGMGVQTAAELGLIAGMTGLTGNIILGDGIGLGSMLGLGSNAVSYKLGVGYLQGNDMNSKAWKAVPIILDGVINLPPEMMGGLSTFVGGGINYVVYRSGQTSGSLGGQVYLGCQGDLGLGGMTYGELGYSIVRTGTSDKGAFSSKSISVVIGQKIML